MTGATLAAIYCARAVASHRDAIAALSGPLAAHWAWRAAVSATQGMPAWERPEAVLRGVKAALEVAELHDREGRRWYEDWPAWERRAVAASR